MLSEGVHSVVDTANEILLLHGMRRAARPADKQHPLGHGRELYFWSFIVALLVFALGAGVSIYGGIRRIRHPQPIENPAASYIVLLLAFIFEGVTWYIALRQFNQARGELGIYQAFRRSKNPPAFTVLFEDTAALIGIIAAAAGTFLAVHYNMPVYDGVASIIIGLVLAATSVLLARESKSLLIGESAHYHLDDDIMRITSEQKSLRGNGVMTFQLAPDQIVVALSVEFDDQMNTSQIEQAVSLLEQKIRAAHPEVMRLFVKPQTAEAFEALLRAREEALEE